MITSIPYAFASLRLPWFVGLELENVCLLTHEFRVYRSLSCAYLISICMTVCVLPFLLHHDTDHRVGAHSRCNKIARQ
jgi:hypothetical protein